MIILGIDPGLRTTGFGLIEKQGNKLRYIASGTIKTAAEGELPGRLKIILHGISEIVRTYQPDCAAIEKVFVNVNPQSTLLLGQARGAAITALASETGGRGFRVVGHHGLQGLPRGVEAVEGDDVFHPLVRRRQRVVAGRRLAPRMQPVERADAGGGGTRALP